jgi:plasmid stabilization system protein ParE
MPRVTLAPDAFDDIDRFLDHMLAFEIQHAPARIAQIIDSIEILSHSPLIGRPVKGGLRELVIGRGVRGCVALYRFVPDLDLVVVLAIRGQRERDLAGPSR